MEGARTRRTGTRIPPLYLYPQVARAYGRALALRVRQGAHHSLRLEMNAAVSTGYPLGWVRGAGL